MLPLCLRQMYCAWQVSHVEFPLPLFALAFGQVVSSFRLSHWFRGLAFVQASGSCCDDAEGWLPLADPPADQELGGSACPPGALAPAMINHLLLGSLLSFDRPLLSSAAAQLVDFE